MPASPPLGERAIIPQPPLPPGGIVELRKDRSPLSYNREAAPCSLSHRRLTTSRVNRPPGAR